MKLVIFGLSISSSWGNGHATLWRGLCRALAARSHQIAFFERDVPYYASHRDLTSMPGLRLHLYAEWSEAIADARAELAGADAGIVTSYCPDGAAAAELVLESKAGVRVFYDLDTPVTLDKLRSGAAVPYLPREGLGGFDLVLSYTGGAALAALSERLGARRVAPLYGSVDPEVHHPASRLPRFEADLSYLGTYALDRQAALDALFLEPARKLSESRFLIGGAMYPHDFPWPPNIFFVRHLPPAEHSAFYSSSLLTLNITRRAMAEMGYCPSGRLFEAAACGTPVVSDCWAGLDHFFEPGREILIARGPGDVIDAISTPRSELAAIGRMARERVLEEHTAARRAREMEALLESAKAPVSRASRR
jgi:spore maturation protein CgeB